VCGVGLPDLGTVTMFGWLRAEAARGLLMEALHLILVMREVFRRSFKADAAAEANVLAR